MRWLLTAGIVLLTACSSTHVKEYPKLDALQDKLDIKALWVARDGEKSPLEQKQLSFAITPDRAFIVDAKGDLMAVELANGKVLWNSKLGIGVSSGPMVDGNLLYVGSTEAQLYAIDVNTGVIRWQTPLSSEILSKPVVYEKYLFQQTIDGKIVALDKETGAKVWVNSHEVPALSLRGTSSPIISKQRVIVGFADGKLDAYDIATGSKIWESTIAVASGRTDLQRMVDIDGLISQDDDEIYAVSYQGRVEALSTENGQPIWSRDMSSYTGVTLDGNQLYLTDDNSQIWAIDRHSGATLWRQDALQGRDVTAPVAVGNSVVVADGAGYVHWVAKEDGAIIARKNLYNVFNRAYFDWGDEHRDEMDFGVSSHLQVADGKVYIRSNMGALFVFQTASQSQAN